MFLRRQGKTTRRKKSGTKALEVRKYDKPEKNGGTTSGYLDVGPLQTG